MPKSSYVVSHVIYDEGSHTDLLGMIACIVRVWKAATISECEIISTIID